MEQIKGIYAAGLSVLDKNLALDVKNTIKHAENVIDLGCHGVVFFGSTGQSQLISLSEKIQLINELPNSRYKNKFIIYLKEVYMTTCSFTYLSSFTQKLGKGK